MCYSSRMPDTADNSADRKTTKRVQSLENKIAYRRRYLDDSRASIRSQFDKKEPDRMKPAQLAHWTKVRDEGLARVDELETRWLAPLEVEYRRLLGLD